MLGKFPLNLSTKEKHNIIQWIANFLIDGDLFCTRPDLILRQCVQEDEMFDVLKACHSKSCGGTLQINEQCIKSYMKDIIGPHFSKMLKYLYPVVMLVREWGDQFL